MLSGRTASIPEPRIEIRWPVAAGRPVQAPATKHDKGLAVAAANPFDFAAPAASRQVRDGEPQRSSNHGMPASPLQPADTDALDDPLVGDDEAAKQGQ